MRKTKKSLAVLLAVLMLASFMPLFASAATITLNSGNCIVLEAPKISYGDQIEVSKITANYGVKTNDLTVTGGKLGYIASEGATPVEIPGTFSATSSLKLSVSENANIRLKFTPDDTTTYSSPTVSNLYDMAEGVVWPSAHIIALKSNLVEKPVPAATTIGINTYLSNSAALSGGKVTDADGNEISGTWSYVNNRAMDTEGTFEEEVQWKKSGYETIKTTVTITVKEFKATLAEAPTMSSLTLAGSFGNMVKNSKASGGKVIDENGNEITGGTWTIEKPSTDYIYCDTTVKAIWKKTGYTTISTDVVIPVIQGHETYTFEKGATLNVSGQTLTYAPELTWESIKINEAIVKDKNGNIVEGTYTLNYLESPTALYSGRIGVYKDGVNVSIGFTPNDTSLPVYYFKDEFTVIKADFTVSEDSELVFNYGTAYKTSYSEYNNDLRFSTIKTIPEEAGAQGIKYVKWAQEDFDPSTADYGTVAMVEVTITPENNGYNNATVIMPIRIQKYVYNADWYGGYTSLEFSGNNEEALDGIKNYKINFTNTRLKGTVDLVINGEVAVSVSPDENGKFFAEGQWIAPENGEYEYYFEYKPSQEDTATVTYPVVKKGSFTIELRPVHTLTIVIGDTVHTEEARYGSAAGEDWRNMTEINWEDFDRWVFTDENGKEFTPKSPYEGTDPIKSDNCHIIMPDHDVTATAKLKGADGLFGDDSSGLGSLWSFWQKLINFIIEIYTQIMNVFVPSVEQGW